MKFGISVSQVYKSQSGYPSSCVVAEFEVGANSVDQAVARVIMSKEYKAILGGEISGICVLEGMSKHKIE